MKSIIKALLANVFSAHLNKMCKGKNIIRAAGEISELRKNVVIPFFLFIFFIQLTMPSQGQVLENGKLRFGNGTEDSFNQYGNLKQPFYFSEIDQQYYKLTWNNPYWLGALDHAFGIGGDKTNEWNSNGQLQVNLIFNNPSTNLAGFILTSPNKGYGTIIRTGTITIDNKVLEITNTYELLQTSSYIKITTRVKNVGTSTVENVRTWVGTGDDFVGTDDYPRKQKGMLINNRFVQNPNTANRALALRISSGKEEVLFFTESSKANMIIGRIADTPGRNHDFLKEIVKRDPTVSNVNQTGDDAYGMYVRFNDLAVGQSDQFTWYYVAGSIINATGDITNIAHNNADFKVTATGNTTGYWIVVPHNSAVPTEAQIKTGYNYGSTTVVAAGSGALTLNTEKIFNLTGLNSATQYDLYFVAQNSDYFSSNIISKSFKTKLSDPTSITASINPICQGNSTILTANGVQGTVYWYTESCGGTLLGTGNSITVTPVTSTTYYARNYDGIFSNGCASLEIKTLISGISGPTAICEYNTAELWATPGFDSYQWFKDGISISGSAGTGLSLITSEGGNYTLAGTAPGGTCLSPIFQLTKNKAPVIQTMGTKAAKIDDTHYQSCGAAIFDIKANYFSSEPHPDKPISFEINYDDGTTEQIDGSVLKLTKSAQVLLHLNSISCSSEFTFHVTVDQVPVKPIVQASGPIAFCQGESVTLTAPAGYTNYYWSNGIWGRSVTVSSAGDYSVKVTNTSGCSSNSDIVTIMINTTASNE